MSEITRIDVPSVRRSQGTAAVPNAGNTAGKAFKNQDLQGFH